MIGIIANFKGSTSGASAAEYALIVAILGGFVVAGALAFGGSLNRAMSTNGSELERVVNSATA